MRLSILTYNIHKGIGTDRLYRLDRIIEVCRELRPDLIAMQEVPQAFRKLRNEDSARIIAEALGMEYMLGINVRLRRGSYGNATFSRFPIERGQNLNITWSIKKPRGCLNSVIRLPNRTQLGFMNFHLGLAGVERRRQIRSILRSAFLESHADLPILMVGDSNDVYNRLYRYLHRAGFADTTYRATEARTFPSYAPLWKLDRVYHNSRVRVHDYRVIRTGLTRVASDHLPILADIEVSTEPH